MSRVHDLERELEQTRAEQERHELARQQAGDAAERRRRLERQGARLLADLEAAIGRLGEELAALAAEAGPSPHRLRIESRRLERDALEPHRAVSGEVLAEPTDRVCLQDPAAALAWSANERVRQAMTQLADLGEGHAQLLRLDALECATWRAFNRRLAELAGEIEG